MPDFQWKCEKCSENNPPYTEACRNCQHLAPPLPPATAEKTFKTTDPGPLYDTSVFKSFRYHTLDEVSQDNFGIDPEYRPYAWLILPAFALLALLTIYSAIDTFETGQTYQKGGRLITGQAAYLQATFGAMASVVLPMSLIKGPKWFSIIKRCLYSGVAILFFWSMVSQITRPIA